jgi:lysophospholipase L1-like esterase
MAQENLRQLAALAKEYDSAFVLANFPTLFHLDSMHPFRRIYDAIEAFARECEIPYIDLFPAFEGKDAPQLWVAPDDQHPNAEGHRIAGEYLARSLKVEP